MGSRFRLWSGEAGWAQGGGGQWIITQPLLSHFLLCEKSHKEDRLINKKKTIKTERKKTIKKKTIKTEVHTDEVDQQLTIAVRSRAKHFCIPYILSQTLRGEELRSRASYVLCAQEGCILRFNLKNIRGCCLQEKSHTQGKPQAKKSKSEVLVP